jgi:hypothetical protein
VKNGRKLQSFFSSWGGVRLSPLGTLATIGLLYQPRMMMIVCGAIGEMSGGGNRSILRNPAEPGPPR